MQGRILKGIGGFYYIETEKGILECKARGIFRKKGLTPLAGDMCTVTEEGSIEEILPRNNAFVRPPVANVDNLIIVFAAAQPAPAFEVVDKLTVAAESRGVKPCIVINKTDIESAEKVAEIYEKTGYPVLRVSAKTGEGTQRLHEILSDGISVFAGCSGVGKTSLMNIILPDAMLKTGRVSEKINRGRHTTREVMLLPCGKNGYIADTPGFSSLEIDEIRAEELEMYFPEFADFPTECRFRGCSHVNEPGCRVKQAVEDGGISRSRYESYVEFYNRLNNIKEWERQ